jgi:GNAT superfamily N-acetyltransferase
LVPQRAPQLNFTRYPDRPMPLNLDEVSVEFLVDRKEAIPAVSNWLFAEWGPLTPSGSAEDIADDLKANLNRDLVPFQLVAMLNEVPIGVAMVKKHELLRMFPERTNWLGCVVVDPLHRNLGIATKLIKSAIDVAEKLGVSVLHLQTENLESSLYARLGWNRTEELEIHGVRRLVMARRSRPFTG